MAGDLSSETKRQAEQVAAFRAAMAGVDEKLKLYNPHVLQNVANFAAEAALGDVQAREKLSKMFGLGSNWGQWEEFANHVSSMAAGGAAPARREVAPTAPAARTARPEPAPAATPAPGEIGVGFDLTHADEENLFNLRLGMDARNAVIGRLKAKGYTVRPDGAVYRPDGTQVENPAAARPSAAPSAPEVSGRGVDTAALIRRYLAATRDFNGDVVVTQLNDVIRGIGQELIRGNITEDQQKEILKAILPSESRITGVVLNGVLDKVEDTIWGIGQAVERADADRVVEALIEGSMNAHVPALIERGGVVVDRGAMREKVLRAGAALRDLRRAGVIYRISASGQVEDALHDMVGELKRKREDIGNIREDTVLWIRDAINGGLISRDGMSRAFEMMADPDAAGLGALIRDGEGRKILYATSQFNPEQLLTVISERTGASKLTVHVAWMIREVVQARMSNEFLRKYSGKAECDWLTILDLETYFTKRSNQSPTKNSPVQVVAEGGLAHLRMQYPSFYRSQYPGGGLKEIGALAGNGLDMRALRVDDLTARWDEALTGKRGASGKGLPRDLMDGVVDAYEVSMFLMKPDLLVDGGKYASDDLSPDKAWTTLLGGLNRLRLQTQIGVGQRDHVVRIMIDTVFAKFDPNSPTFDSSLRQRGDGDKRMNEMREKCAKALDAMRKVFGDESNYLPGSNGLALLTAEDKKYYEQAYEYYYKRLNFPVNTPDHMSMRVEAAPYRVVARPDLFSEVQKQAVVPVLEKMLSPLDKLSELLGGLTKPRKK